MMVTFTEDAERDLRRVGEPVASRIMRRLLWFTDHFAEQTPEPLGGNLRGYYKLRIGDWRVVYDFDRMRNAIVVHLVDHRSNVYRS